MREKKTQQNRFVARVAKQSKCPVCSKGITGGVAYFSFGATIDQLVLKRHRLRDTVMEGFCHLGYHGTDQDMSDSSNYCVADGVKGGQLDIEFCSVRCLKKWFGDIIDSLKGRLMEEKRAGKGERLKATSTKRLKKSKDVKA